MMAEGAGALSGVRVVEIAAGRAVAYCSKLLAQCGAEVIRVEPPGGDAIRRGGPFAADRFDLDAGGLHRLLNAGKRSVELDVTSEGDAERAARLVDSCELVVTNWRAPVASSALPLADAEAWRARFPGTTLLSISPFGRTGPYAEHEADSHIIEALAGMSYVGGDPDREPLSSGVELADYFAAAEAWVAGLAALLEAGTGPRPGFVDVSIHESLTLTDDHNLSVYLGSGYVRRRFYSQILPGYPSDIFACKDGYVAFVTAGRGGRDFAGNVSKLIDRPELETHPLFTSMRERVLHQREFDAIVKPWLESHTKEEVFRRAGELELGFGEVPNVRDLLADEHLRVRGLWHRDDGSVIEGSAEGVGWVQTGPPAKLSGTPLRVGPAAPRLGEGNEELLSAVETASGGVDASGAWSPSRSGRLRFFEGLRVLDLSRGWTGSLAGRVLGELGADVVKVEYARPPHSSISPAYFTVRQASKRSVALDLRTESGRELMLRLLARADVFVENFPPRVMEQFRLRYADLRERFPRLVMCSIAGYGQDGPNGYRPALGMTMEPASGPASVTGYAGEGPLKTGQTWVDPYAGFHGVGGVLAALRHREETGVGQHIDVSMQESTVPTLDWFIADYTLNGRLHGGDGNRRPGMLRGTYRCRDEAGRGGDDWVSISLRDDAEWEAFCRATGHEGWLSEPRYADAEARMAQHDELDERITAWTSERSKFAVAALLQSAGVPAGAVLKADEVLSDPQLAARELFDRVPVLDLGRVPIQRYFPVKFDGLGLSTKTPVARFGEHTVEELRATGLSDEEIRSAMAGQELFDMSEGTWNHPELRAAREQEFLDYLQIGSVLRRDEDYLERFVEAE